MIGTAQPAPAPSASSADREVPPAGPVDLGTATSITTFGTLFWYGPLLGLVTVAYAVVVTCVARWGEVDTSLWASVVAGWQRWPIGVAGFLMISTFARMFVVNGVGRRRLGDAATVTMLILTALSGAVITAGFLIERIVYDNNGWPQMNDEREITYGAIGYGTVLVGYAIAAAAYFVSGWLVGAVFNRDANIIRAVAAVPLVLVPTVASELFVSPMAGGAQVDALGALTSMPLWVGAPLTVAIIALATLVARRLTIDVVVK